MHIYVALTFVLLFTTALAALAPIHAASAANLATTKRSR